MSDSATLDFSKERRETEAMVSSLEQLQKKMEALDKQNLGDVKSALARLNSAGSRDLEELKSQVLNTVTDIERRIRSLGTVTANFNIGEAFGKEVNAIKAQAAELTAMYRVRLAEINQMQKKASDTAVGFSLEAAREQARIDKDLTDTMEKNMRARMASATRMSEDDTRALLGMPSRDSMKTFAASIKSQMQDEMSTAKLRAASASSMNEDDTRALLGMPSRDSMKSFAASIKSQMSDEMSNAKLKAASATAMNEDDTRALLGMPSRDSMKSFAASIKSQMSDEMSNAKLKAASATSMNEDDTRALLGMPSRDSMRSFASSLKAQMQDEMQKARWKAASATPMNEEDTRALLGMPSRAEMSKFAAMMKESMTPPVGAPEAAKVSMFGDSLKKLTGDMGDVHSAARGLASGFDLLWLTWGRLVPLFAGAAVSFGLRKTFDIGSDIEYQIKFMEVLGQAVDGAGKNYSQFGSVVRAELRAIDQTTLFSMQELAKSMVTLGQAGKTPAESLAMLRPAADLAAAGMTNLDTTTSLLIQTQALYGKSAADSAKMAAQIFSITKDGVLNVNEIAESMKYASEANTRFGKSFEESLTLLGALANAGLKASSGGTAFINFLRDLNGRSKASVQALKDLEKASGDSIKVWNNDGTQRAAIEIFNDIAKAAKNLKNEDADKLLAKIFSDRGGRLFYAMVRDGNTDLQAMVDKLKEVKPEVLFDAAKGLMDTTKGALDILKGSLVGALDTVFEANSGKFKGFIKDISAAIQSDGFTTAVQGMVLTVSTLYDAVSSIMPLLVAFAEAWMVYKVVTIGVAVFQAASGALAALAPMLTATVGGLIAKTTATVADTAANAVNTGSLVEQGIAMIGNAAASRAAAAGMTAAEIETAKLAATQAIATTSSRILAGTLAFLANPLVGVITTLALVGSAFWATKSAAENSLPSVSKAVVENGQININQWNKEIETLRARNALMNENKYGNLTASISQAEDALNALLIKEQQLQQEGAPAIEATTAGGAAMAYASKASAARARLAALQKDIDKARQNVAQMKGDLANLEAEDEARSRKAKEKADKDAAEAAERARQGSKTVADASAAGRAKHQREFTLTQDNELTMINERYKRELGLLNQSVSDDKAILEAKHNAHLISEGEYQARLYDLSASALSAGNALTDKAIQDEKDAYDKAYGYLVEARRKAVAANAAPGTIDRIDQVMGNLQERYNTLMKGFDVDKATNIAKLFLMQELAAIKAKGAIWDLTEADRKYWKADANEIAKIKSVNDLNEKYKFAADSAFDYGLAAKAGEEAAAAATEKHLNHIMELDNKWVLAQKAADDYATENKVKLAEGDKDAIDRLTALKETANDILDIVGKARVSMVSSIAERADMAAKEVARKQQDALVNSVADAIYTGLTEGGQAGSASLRKILEDELRKPVVMVIRAIIEPIIGDLVGGVMSMLGLGGSGGSGLLGNSSKENSDSNSAVGILSSIRSIFKNSDLFTRGGMLQAMKDGMSLLGDKFASWGFDSLGDTLKNISVDSLDSALSFAKGAGYLQAFLAATKGNWGQAIGTAIGTYIGGPLGSMIGNTIGKLVDNMFSGETRTGGQYAMASGDSVYNQRRNEYYTYDSQRYNEMGNTSGNKVVNGEIYKTEADGFGTDGDKYIKNLMKNTVTGINDTLKALGSAFVVQNFWGGVETSGKGRGGVYSGGAFSNGIKFGESGQGDNYAGTLYERTSTNSPDAKTAIENFTLDMKQVTIEALQAATDIPQSVKDVLKDVNAEALTSDEADAILKTINDMIVSVETLKIAAANMPIKNLVGLSFDAYNALAKLGGGIDQLMTDINAYYSNFYSADEQKAQTLSNIQAALAKVGLSMPKTREEFRKMVEQQDLNTEAGRKNFAALMAVSSAFASVTQSAEEAAAAAKEAAKQQLDAALAAVKRAIDAQKEILNKQKEAINAQKDAINKQITDLNASITAQQSVYDNLTNIIGTLDSAIRDLFGTVSSTASMMVDEAQAVIDKALRTGILPANDVLATAINTLKTKVSNADNYSSQFEKDRATLVLANQLDSIKGNATNQQTDAQRALDVAKAQLDALNKQLGVLDEQLADLDKQIKALDDMYTELEKQTQALEGVDVSVMSVEEAVAKLHASMLNYLIATTTGGKPTDPAADPSANPVVVVTKDAAVQAKADAAKQQVLTQDTTDKVAQSVEKLEKQNLTLDKNLGYTQVMTGDLSTVKDLTEEQNKMMSIGHDDMTGLSEVMKNLNTSMVTAMAALAAAVASAAASAAAARASAAASSGPSYSTGSFTYEGSTDVNYWRPVSKPDPETGAIPKSATAEEDIYKLLVGSYTPAFASGGYHTGGLRLVGEDGPELEVTGPSRIYNASQTTEMLRSLSQGGSGSADTAESDDSDTDLLMTIADNISGMRDDLQTQAGASVRLALSMDKRFNRWDGDGLPPTRT